MRDCILFAGEISQELLDGVGVEGPAPYSSPFFLSRFSLNHKSFLLIKENANVNFVFKERGDDLNIIRIGVTKL